MVEDNPTQDFLISIITVTWNNLAGLKKTVESINEQSFRDKIQWVVIDGGSKDGSQDFVKSKIKNGDILISEKDNGLYDAMNKGIDNANGQFLWFLNAGDTIFAYNNIQILSKHFENNDLIYGETMLTDIEGKHLGTRTEKTTRKIPQELNLKSMLGGMVVNHQSVIIKKEFCPKFSLKWEIASDYDWMCTALEQEIKTKNSWIIHSCFELGGLSSQRIKSSWKERFLIMKEHFGFWKSVKAHLNIILRKIKLA